MSRTKKWKKMEINSFNSTSQFLNEERRECILKCYNIEEAHIEEAKKFVPFYYAAETGDRESLVKFLDRGVFEKDIGALKYPFAEHVKNNYTPLHVAATKGNAEIVQMFLNYGYDVNAEDHHHMTPLHCAAFAGNHKILKILLEAGADPSVAMHEDNCTEILNCRTSLTPLLLAASKFKCMKLLLQFGADCSVRDHLNRTCLYFAAQSGAEECVLYLLRNTSCESFLSLPCSSGALDTPLHLAVTHGMLQCVIEMVRMGSDTNYRNGEDMSPLHVICCSRSMKRSVQMEILKVLVLEGRNTDMNSAFHPSYFHRYTTEAKVFLIAYGANINVRNNKIGLTFLEYELSCNTDRDLMKFITKGLPTLPLLQCLKLFPVIEDMPNKSTMWYSSVLPNDVTFNLLQGKSSMYVEMRNKQNLRSENSNFQTQLDTVINRPLRKLFLLQQPFLDLLYNHIHAKLKEKLDPNIEYTSFEYYSSTPYLSRRHHLRQLLHFLWYQKLASEPLSLMHHCRYSIRKCMGPSNVKHINKLVLPTVLKSYLMFDYSGETHPFETIATNVFGDRHEFEVSAIS